jgi:hypothetical protein
MAAPEARYLLMAAPEARYLLMAAPEARYLLMAAPERRDSLIQRCVTDILVRILVYEYLRTSPRKR